MYVVIISTIYKSVKNISPNIIDAINKDTLWHSIEIASCEVSEGYCSNHKYETLFLCL